MAGKLANKLQALDEAWVEGAKKAKENSGFPKVDDGKYLTRLNRCEIDESANGRMQICWEFVVMQGEITGTTIYKYDGLDRPEGTEYICQTMQRFGFDPEEIVPFSKNIEGVCEQIHNRKQFVVVTAKTNKNNPEFQNIYVNKVYAEGVDPTE